MKKQELVKIDFGLYFKPPLARSKKDEHILAAYSKGQDGKREKSKHIFHLNFQ